MEDERLQLSGANDVIGVLFLTPYQPLAFLYAIEQRLPPMPSLILSGDKPVVA